MSLFLTFITRLMLGMRHATDPDHIVAVTTIVSRERSVVKAAGIGALWGAGQRGKPGLRPLPRAQGWIRGWAVHVGAPLVPSVN